MYFGWFCFYSRHYKRGDTIILIRCFKEIRFYSRPYSRGDGAFTPYGYLKDGFYSRHYKRGDAIELAKYLMAEFLFTPL